MWDYELPVGWEPKKKRGRNKGSFTAETTLAAKGGEVRASGKMGKRTEAKLRRTSVHRRKELESAVWVVLTKDAGSHESRMVRLLRSWEAEDRGMFARMVALVMPQTPKAEKDPAEAGKVAGPEAADDLAEQLLRELKGE